ncbi:hypothetical protein SETIT_3G274700v2 [Setaria italica]|uniref:Uncharacterized protein n=1 Tax=Setaria italica TaxID=4555 RepID=A0A368QJG2_SETIT|nr:hypothetical protein SETIT_3G274700v2 [Setaria italica]
MASPAGLRPASPPAIPGAAAVAACAAMAVSYVAVLYAPTVILRFPPPTSLRAFLHRRFACAAVASTASALATAALLRVWSLGDFADMLAVFGIRKDHLLQAVAIPLFLTSLVYAGSFVNKLWPLASSWGGDGDEAGISSAQRLVLRIQAALDDVMVWRNYVVGVHDTTSFMWWIQNVYNYFFESSLLQSSTLKSFVRATTARMQFYEVTTDCRCPVRLHCNLRVVCSIFVHSNRESVVSYCCSRLLQYDGFACFFVTTDKRSGVGSTSGWFSMFLLAPFPCNKS